MGCAVFSVRKKSYSDQIEEMMFEHIVQQLRGINMAEAFEQEEEEEEEQEQEEEQVDSEDSESEEQEQVESEQEEQVESEESNDADNEQEQEQDIEYVEETHTEYDDLPDLVEEPVAPVEAPSESSDDTDIAPPSKRARRGHT
jgi:cobalamin biosynthesis protein CobT